MLNALHMIAALRCAMDDRSAERHLQLGALQSMQIMLLDYFRWILKPIMPVWQLTQIMTWLQTRLFTTEGSTVPRPWHTVAWFEFVNVGWLNRTVQHSFQALPTRAGHRPWPVVQINTTETWTISDEYVPAIRHADEILAWHHMTHALEHPTAWHQSAGRLRQLYMENVSDRYFTIMRHEVLMGMEMIMSKAIFCRTTHPEQGPIATHRQADDEGTQARRDRVTCLWLEFKHIAQVKFITSIQLKQTAKEIVPLTGTCTGVYAVYRDELVKLKGVSQLMLFEECYSP